MTTDQLLRLINTVPKAARATTPYPEEWVVDDPYAMLALVDQRILGFDGFKFCFHEYAQACWRACQRARSKTGRP